jgi:hypothetical protein
LKNEIIFVLNNRDTCTILIINNFKINTVIYYYKRIIRKVREMKKTCSLLMVVGMLTGSAALAACPYKSYSKVWQNDLVTMRVGSAAVGTRDSFNDIHVNGMMVFDRSVNRAMTCNGSSWVYIEQGNQGVRGVSGNRGARGARGAGGYRGATGYRGRDGRVIY